MQDEANQNEMRMKLT